VNAKNKQLKGACTGVKCLKKYSLVTTKPFHSSSSLWMKRTVFLTSDRTFHNSATVLRLSERTRYINRPGNVRKKKRLKSQVYIYMIGHFIIL
jgi:hypothetical protein